MQYEPWMDKATPNDMPNDDLKFVAEKAGMKNVFRTTRETAADDLKAFVREGDALLVKASRGMHLEEAVDKIMLWK